MLQLSCLPAILHHHLIIIYHSGASNLHQRPESHRNGLWPVRWWICQLLSCAPTHSSAPPPYETTITHPFWPKSVSFLFDAAYCLFIVRHTKFGKRHRRSHFGLYTTRHYHIYFAACCTHTQLAIFRGWVSAKYIHYSHLV